MVRSFALHTLILLQTLAEVDVLVGARLDQGEPVLGVTTQQEVTVVAFKLAIAMGECLSFLDSSTASVGGDICTFGGRACCTEET